ncbi:hypothetical protein [Micromonospora robiginosa]|uniref:Uncharacterized protein n=1 Tax=Micromonospora robiginosa TaxID=2749844 RepID=A0A7L6B4M8_9ACTN|nr:hypothetical protein [Micromonospora ferruginea]QLQ36765.1 hypothetical protein H1D33_26520 [Micromonospora ferruginea]
MMIAGYEDIPLVDGTPLLNDALFWPTFLAGTMAPHRDSLVASAFGVALDDCFDYFSRLTDADAWPSFRIALPDGYEIDLVYWNEPGEKGNFFILCQPERGYQVDLANVGGHEFRPGLSWPELTGAANPSSASDGVVDPSARLLLLLPTFGDADVPPEATAMTTAALRACGAGSEADELAAYLLREPERWPRWRTRADGALVCDGRYSRRNPEGPAGHPSADLLEISSALTPR